MIKIYSTGIECFKEILAEYKFQSWSAEVWIKIYDDNCKSFGLPWNRNFTTMMTRFKTKKEAKEWAHCERVRQTRFLLHPEPQPAFVECKNNFALGYIAIGGIYFTPEKFIFKGDGLDYGTKTDVLTFDARKSISIGGFYANAIEETSTDKITFENPDVKKIIDRWLEEK